MAVFWHLILLGSLLSLVLCEQAFSPYQSQRNGKFVSIRPEACYSGGYEGLCLPVTSCRKVNGRVSSYCFWKFGECCQFDKSCGEESEARVSYFTSQSQLANTQGVCTMKIIPSNNVCQLHLHLTEFDMPEPDAQGNCLDQYFHVLTDAGSSPYICGNSTGQHLYIDVKGQTSPVKLFVVTVKSGLTSTWDIKVDQIHCTSSELAPTGCLQNPRGIRGEVKSFNYHPTIPSSYNQTGTGKPGTRQLQMSYNVCVRRESGYCSIKWKPAHNGPHAFSVTGVKPPVDNVTSIDSDCQNTDYLIVLDGKATIGGQTEHGNVICGSRFPDYVQSSSFQLGVVTNDKEAEDGDFDNRGFHLRYEQQKCP